MTEAIYPPEFTALYSLNNIQEEARRVLSLGMHFAVVPPMDGVPAKDPHVKGWPAIAHYDLIDPEHITEYCNIGVLTGSQVTRNSKPYWVVDIDIDNKAAVPVFASFMPRTMMWGRPGKPRSHYLYFVDRPVITRVGSHQGKVVEIFGLSKKGTPGHQSVLPPSIWHKDGHFERLRYEGDSLPAPAIISAEELLGACGHE